MSDSLFRSTIEMTQEEGFMRRAIEIAERGRHRVMPNPLVGCVLVKDGNIVAEGWHDHIGGLHAEQMAIADAESKGVPTRGTTAYVSLEPCNHFGRTPPCTESLLWAGVSRVVIGSLDPNPTVRGGGVDALTQAGVDVDVGLLEDECEGQMRHFMHWCKNRRPLVTMKASTDSEGRVDGPSSQPSSRFSSDRSLELSHEIRAESMAILVGIGTVLRDNPSLTVRGPDIGPRGPPIRVVIDPSNRISRDCKLMVDSEAPTLLIQSSEYDSSQDLPHVERLVIAEEEIPVSSILDMLGDRGVQSLLVEGGPYTWSRFLSEKMVDRARICVSDVDLGGDGPVFETSSVSDSGLILISRDEISGDFIEWWARS